MKICATLVFLIAVSLGSPAFGVENNPEQQKSFGDVLVSKALDRVAAKTFSEDERSRIKEFLDTQKSSESEGRRNKAKGRTHKGLPPGLAKKDHLPPGLEKQLEKNGHLPPGLEKRDLPGDLVRKLPSCSKKKSGCAIVGDDVVLMDKTTDLILDVIEKTISH